ncbi:hypothetical protein AX16_004277 [Volvariella volvacea WC 439]|nr:hypothetical protein AX16_004277 [Volvariella volvacea WC 439]
MPSQQQADSVTRALSLNDVLQQILSHLDKKTLVYFALVRRSSSEPALDLVWRDLPSFLPLLRLIPGFQMVNSQYVLTGNASEWGWSRYEFYAPRVRILNLATGTQQVPVAPGIYSCVARTRLTSIPLLPNLTTLNSGDISSSDYPESLLLNVAGPHLTELNISANAQSDRFLTSLFTTLPICAPQIESISFSDNQRRTQPHDIFSSLQYFHNLRRLSLTANGSPISLKFLKELGQREIYEYHVDPEHWDHSRGRRPL